MAEAALPPVREIIINELLCYLICKFKKLSINTLKCTVADFYSASCISSAKEALVEAVDNINLDKWPKPARRKQSDSKFKIELDDIVNVLEYLDENLLLDKLPCFVALNVDNLPSNRIEEGDLRCILNKIALVDQKIDLINKPVSIGLPNNVSHDSAIIRSSAGPPPSRSWADRAATPRQHDTDSDTFLDDPMDTFTVVKNKRKRVFSPNFSSQPATGPQPMSTVSRRSTLTRSIVGSNATCPMKAAKELRKNRIFCVSNMSADSTCDELRDYLTVSGIKVHKIFFLLRLNSLIRWRSGRTLRNVMRTNLPVKTYGARTSL